MFRTYPALFLLLSLLGCSAVSGVDRMVFSCQADGDCAVDQFCFRGTCVVPTDAGVPACVVAGAERCANQLDDDCDGWIDCEDPACGESACGSNGEVCRAGICDPGGTVVIPALAEAQCADNQDNDGNGYTDCKDSACAGLTCGFAGKLCSADQCVCLGSGGPLEVPEQSCADGHDNDCNGLTDCAESGCGGAACGANGRFCVASACACSGNGGVAQLAESTCNDGKDNDCDGRVDCAQAGCAGKACGSGAVCSVGGCLCIAAYDATLQIPRCAGSCDTCASGVLLNGRAQMSGGNEPSSPNARGVCPDGLLGTYHVEESLDTLSVKTVVGGPFVRGKQVRIEAKVYSRDPAEDRLDLFYADDADSPTWVPIVTLQPLASGEQTLIGVYTLPAKAGMQAIRGSFRVGPATGACPAGDFNDRDDLSFDVR